MECPSDWGWTFIYLLVGGLLVYAGGGIAYNHKVKGEALALSSLPHKEYWRGVYGLVADGAMYAYVRATGSRTGGYTSVSTSANAEPAKPQPTAQPDDKSPRATDSKKPRTIPQPFAEGAGEELTASEDDTLVE